jgi:hypothetical protein
MSALRNCEAIEVPEVGDTSGRDVLKVATRCDLPNSQIYKAELKYVTRSIPTRYPPQGWGGYGGVEVPPSGRDLGWEKKLPLRDWGGNKKRFTPDQVGSRPPLAWGCSKGALANRLLSNILNILS